MKKLFLALLASLPAVCFAQVKTEVTNFKLTGSVDVTAPLMINNADVMNKPFDDKALLDGVKFGKDTDSKEFIGGTLPASGSKSAGELYFYIQNDSYLKGSVSVEGLKCYKLYVDGVETSALALQPLRHKVSVKYITEGGETPKVVIDAPEKVSITTDEAHEYDLHDVLDGERVLVSRVSACGKYYMAVYVNTLTDGTSQYYTLIKDVKTGRLIERRNGTSMMWMPRSSAYVYDESTTGCRRLHKVNPVNGSEEIIAENLPAGSLKFSPDEKYIIITATAEGPQERKEIIRVVKPDDRIPGWRTRPYLIKYDMATGISNQITFGSDGVMLCDISADAGKLLVMVNKARLEKRPTTVSDLYIIDAATLNAEKILENSEFVSMAHFSPDAKQLLVEASPEAFDGIGCNNGGQKYSNMFDVQLYKMDIATKNITPLTCDFNPAVMNATWSAVDGNIYFKAADRDYESMYVLNAKNGKISRLNLTEEVVNNFSMASSQPVMTYVGCSTVSPQKLYVVNLKNKKETCLEDNSADILKNVKIGECHDWNFVSSRGDTICGRYYLPHDFDPAKKYPMIVNYYGGCSPVNRQFGTRYPHAYYTSLGYVVYVVQPSGAIGFGQEFSSRHVNTWGKGVAEDIIEGTKKFCEEHQYVDSKKIGCIGASYGGFMTQYLQTVTDIFACAISHAGISNIASYWGEGYWGYSYGEVASAGSYPWNAAEMYVKQSPLFNADKIHTPLLLLHGNSDTNVPLIESIQMFNALKLLGRDVAFVQIDGEDHHITDYHKRFLWTYAQMAWFEKYLKGNDNWWNSMFPETSL